MKTKKPRKVELTLEYQNYIEAPPIAPAQMYGNACSSDTVTINAWRKIWLENVAANHKRFGSFEEHSIGKLFKAHALKPCVIAGSGPSLSHNGADLKERGDIPLVSCLHNY